MALSFGASTQEIETMVVTGKVSKFGATKSNVPIVETARSISIETSDQFKEKGALNLSQTVTYLAGVTGETFGFATRGDWISARGLQLPRYRDSIQELFGSFNTTRAEIYTIEQVEVLKGPASVLYGQGNPGGIVNYISKTPKAEAATEVEVQLGNFDRQQVGIDSTGKLGSDQWLYRLVLLNRDSDTQVDFVNDDTLVFMPSITYAPSDNTRFTVISIVQNTDSDTGSQFIPVVGTLLPLADGSFLPNQDVYAGEPEFNRFNADSNQFTVLAEHQISKNVALEATALWRDGEVDYHQAWPSFTGGQYLNDFVGFDTGLPDTTVARSFFQADNTFEQYAGDVRFKVDFNTKNIEHQMVAGVQLQLIDTDANSSFFFAAGVLAPDFSPLGDFSYVLNLANPVYTGNFPDQATFDALYVDNPAQTVEDMGLYLSDQISIGNWRFTAGVRYDQVDNDIGTAISVDDINGSTTQSDSEISLSFGGLYGFENGFAPYVNYSESFETVLPQVNSGILLRPQRGEQFEAGLKYQPDGFPGIVTFSYFDIEVSNLSDPNALPGEVDQQIGISDISGFELEAQATFGDVYIQGAISTLDAVDEAGFAYSSQPESHASLWAAWQVSNSFRLGGGVRHVDQSVSENTNVRLETPSYTLSDIMIGFSSNEEWELALNIRNVADKEYLTSCLARGDCFPGVRRTANATLTYNL